MKTTLSIVLILLFYTLSSAQVEVKSIRTSNNNCKARVLVQAEGSAGPFDLVLSGPQEYTKSKVNGQHWFHGVCAGMYTLTATDAFGCEYTESVDITCCEVACGAHCDLGEVVFSNVKLPYPVSEPNGEATVSYNGTFDPVNSPLEIKWSDGYVENGSTSTRTDLKYGTYWVTITEYECCSVTGSVFIDVYDCDNIEHTINSDCEPGGGTSLGSIYLIIPSSKYGPYQYEWFKRSNPQNILSTQKDLINVEVGIYTVRRTDNLGCETEKIIFLQDLSSDVQLIDFEVNSSDCPTDPNGSIIINTVCCYPPYHYSWSTGQSSSSPILEDVSNGSYTVTIQNSVGCSNVFNLEVPEPFSFNFHEASIGASCGENNDGSVWIMTGINFSSVEFFDNEGNSLGVSNNRRMSGLSPGDYSYEITDVDGCIYQGGFEIKQWAEPIVNIDISPACGGIRGGTFELSIDFDFDYDVDFSVYLWDEIYKNPSSPILLDNLKSNQYVNGYLLYNEKQDISGKRCKIDFSAIIPNTIDVEPVVEDYCNDYNGGKITLNTSGGQLPYSYKSYDITNGLTETDSPYFTDLKSGYYSFTVTDANGCSQKVGTWVERSPSVSGT